MQVLIDYIGICNLPACLSDRSSKVPTGLSEGGEGQCATTAFVKYMGVFSWFGMSWSDSEFADISLL